MSKLSSETLNYLLRLNSSGSDNDEDDDFVTFQFESQTINLNYSQLSKYSKHIREKYVFSDITQRLPQELHTFHEQFNIQIDNIILFFQLLQQNLEINENLTLTYKQLDDLFKISKCLQIKKLPTQLRKYFKIHNVDVDFIIQVIIYEAEEMKKSENYKFQISEEMEAVLTTKIDECFLNEKFAELPISIIYRITELCWTLKWIKANNLFDFIKKSIQKYGVLFQFLDLKQLSDDRLENLIEIYSDESNRQIFGYMKCNLDMVKELIDQKKNFLRQLKSIEKVNDELKQQFKDLEKNKLLCEEDLKKKLIDSEKIKDEKINELKKQELKINQLEKQLAELEKNKAQSEEDLKKKLIDSEKVKDEKINELKKQELKINQLEKQLAELEKNKAQNEEDLKKKLIDSEKVKDEKINELKNLELKIDQLEKQLAELEKVKQELEEEKIKMQKQLKDSDDANKELQKRLEEEMVPIKGQINASVKSGLLINASIKLYPKGLSLDTTKSKYILSSSDANTIGFEAYQKGETITSDQMNTIDFICKPGKYYVRCLVFNSEGKSAEIVSNPVTTSGNNVLFSYEGKPVKVSLFKVKYKLEVWGAKGGDSTGSRENNSYAKGGLGGYSCGILTLKENETVHVFVGGEGRPSNSSDGSTTNGGFPDGGGTKTGHYQNYTSVPGTGGGSTSIRIGSDSDYARLIVAGGGGGASGSCCHTNHGGFGGGLNGGNCYCDCSLRSQGSGTQTGSTCGLGWGIHGDPGRFGHGADGKYKSGCNSGGGGGGGWYGGGSGGHGNFRDDASGGGGSGWIFTESNFNAWQSGDSSNASKFIPQKSFYLTNAKTVAGDNEFPKPDGNGNERGHSGNGYAKITLE